MKQQENKKKVYIGGDMLYKGSRDLRDSEKKQINAIGGYSIYNPKDNKEINDKQNQSVESNNKLAEKIVKQDTDAIFDSDVIVIEPTAHAFGTMVELGQIKGMKDTAKEVMKLINENTSYPYKVNKIKSYLKERILDKEVYPHYEDCRRTDIPEVGDRRSFGFNQYVHGVCLDLTNGKGLYEWDEILEKLGKSKETMVFQDAYELLKQGICVRRKEWEGYWKWENNSIMMHCKDGKVLDIRETQDVAFTVSNILADDWEIVE